MHIPTSIISGYNVPLSLVAVWRTGGVLGTAYSHLCYNTSLFNPYMGWAIFSSVVKVCNMDNLGSSNSVPIIKVFWFKGHFILCTMGSRGGWKCCNIKLCKLCIYCNVCTMLQSVVCLEHTYLACVKFAIDKIEVPGLCRCTQVSMLTV